MSEESDALVRNLVTYPQQNASYALAANVNTDPDQAAEAIDLEKDTGIPAPQIMRDPEGVKAQHAAALGKLILSQNTHLQRYINDNPMHAAISNGDWGNLDHYSKQLDRLVGPTPIERAIQGAIKGWDPDTPLGDSILHPMTAIQAGSHDAMDISDAAFQKAYPKAYAFAAGFFHGVPELVERGFSSAFGGLKGFFTGAAMTHLGLDENNAEQFANHIMAGAEYITTDPGAMHAHMHTKEVFNQARDNLKALADAGVNVDQAINRWTGTKDVIGAYGKSGEVPPPRMDPILDQAHISQAESDVQALDDAFAAAQKSGTRERSAEIFSHFSEMKLGERNIEIPAEAVRRLYGNTQPLPEDGVLGWVPDLQRQLEANEPVGGDIQIPLREWLARADPEVAKALHDDIRVREGGLTLNEAKDLAQAQPTGLEIPSTEGVGARASEDPALSLARHEGGLNLFTREGSPEGWATAGGETDRFMPGDLGEFGQNLVGVRGTIVPTDEMNANQREVFDRVSREIDRMTGGTAARPAVGIKDLHATRAEGSGTLGASPARGLYRTQHSLILWSLDSDDAVGTARHEVIHHLRQRGFFTPEEWGILEQASKDGKWAEKHQIPSRYPKASPKLTLEESIAEEFKDWRRNGEPPVGRAGLVFQKLQDLLERIKSILRDTFGRPPTVDDLFQRVERGDIAERGGATGEPTPSTFAQAGERPGPGEGTGEPMFTGRMRLGMTVDQYNRWVGRLNKRIEEDAKRAQEKARKVEARTQTAEWRKNREAEEAVARDAINRRPDIIADEFLRLGKVGEARLRGTMSLDRKFLTKDQQKGLNEFHMEREGIRGLHPDDVARYAGYASGEALLNRLNMLEQARRARDMKPWQYKESLIKAETDLRMEKKYGDLDENIMKAARDHAISDTQIDMMHEELQAHAMRLKVGSPIDKETFKSWAKDAFDKLNFGAATEVRWLRNAGKYGQMMEQALLKGDEKTAFHARQVQFQSMLLADEAKKFQRENATFDRTTKTYQKNRQVKGIPQDFTNWIHYMLERVGRTIPRTEQDLEHEIAAARGGSTLNEFINYQQNYGNRPVDAHEMFLNPSFRKNLEAMTTDEARGVFTTIANFIHVAREEGKITIAGEKFDLEVWKDRLAESLDHMSDKPLKPGMEHKRGLIGGGKKLLCSVLQLEALFNRWERGDPLGPWNKFFQEFARAANNEATMQRNYSKMLRDLSKLATDADRTIENPIFRYQKGFNNGDLMPFTRNHLRTVMLNMGNASNMDALARGYKLKPEAIRGWVNSVATEGDWKFVQGVADIFRALKKEADIVYRESSGVAPEGIDLFPFDTPFGRQLGYYYPLIYSKLMEGKSPKLIEGGLVESGYHTAMTPNSHFKKRINYQSGVVDLESMHMLSARIGSYIHDIAFRQTVIDGSKIFYDDRMRNLIAQKAGLQYKEMLNQWLKNVANNANVMDSTWAGAIRFSESLRQNAINTYVGLNPSTVLKHGPTAAVNSLQQVGPDLFVQAFRTLFGHTEMGEREWTFAMRTSEELQRRHRNWMETLGAGQQLAMGGQGLMGSIKSLRQTIFKIGATPVALSDLATAVPTWMSAYYDAMSKGLDHGTAVDLGDRAVRAAHGSTAVTSRPLAMQSKSPLGAWLTSLYGFWNHIANKYYEIGWRSHDLITGKTRDADSMKAKVGEFSKITWMVASYVIAPVVIEELVRHAMGQTTKKEDKEDWPTYGAKALLNGASSTIPIFRDLAWAAVSSRDPRIGLMSSATTEPLHLIGDISRGSDSLSPQHAGKTMSDFVTTMGILTGMTNATEAKALEMMYRYGAGLEHPKGMGDWVSGLHRGTLKRPH